MLINVIFLENKKIVKVKKGFFINYLLPKKKAIIFNKKNDLLLKKNLRNKIIEKNVDFDNDNINCEKINKTILFFELKKTKNEKIFGSIREKEILNKLKELKIFLKKKQLINFFPINKLGEKILEIRLSNNLIANLKIIIK